MAVRDLSLLSTRDPKLLRLAEQGDWTLVTNNIIRANFAAAIEGTSPCMPASYFCTVSRD
jgi:hypothetical protein